MNFVLSDATSPYTRGKYLTLLPRNKLVTIIVPSSLEQYTNKNISVVGAGGDHEPNGRNALNPQVIYKLIKALRFVSCP